MLKTLYTSAVKFHQPKKTNQGRKSVMGCIEQNANHLEVNTPW